MRQNCFQCIHKNRRLPDPNPYQTDLYSLLISCLIYACDAFENRMFELCAACKTEINENKKKYNTVGRKINYCLLPLQRPTRWNRREQYIILFVPGTKSNNRYQLSTKWLATENNSITVLNMYNVCEDVHCLRIWNIFTEE